MSSCLNIVDEKLEQKPELATARFALDKKLWGHGILQYPTVENYVNPGETL